METQFTEQRRASRRRAERRRKARAAYNRRKLADRRSKALGRAPGAQAAAYHRPAPKPQAAEPLPRKASRVSLYNITLLSLAGVNPRLFAAELVNLRVVPSVEAARRALLKTPATLARYVPEETASAVCSSLRATGADTVWLRSHVTCPHCEFPVPCDGEADQSGRGVTFSCPACSGLTLLDSRDRNFHPLLRCGACNSLLNLPVNARAGKYRCKCGTILSHDRFQSNLEFVAERPFDTPCSGRA